MAQSIKMKEKKGQNAMKKTFLPLSCHEWQKMGSREVSYSYLVPAMIW